MHVVRRAAKGSPNQAADQGGYEDMLRRHVDESSLTLARRLEVEKIVHDTNNALLLISGAANILLASDVLDNCKADSVELVKTMKQAIDDAGSIATRVRSLVDSSRRHGKQVDLGVMLLQATSMVEPIARSRARGRAIHVKVDAPPFITAIGDDYEIRESLLNLIINAIDAMPDGGQLTLSLTFEKGAALISVSDTGVGMTDEVLQRCIEPQFSTKNGDGTGMGLSAVNDVATKYSGKLSIQSVKDKGTTVTLRLPAMLLEPDE